MRLKRDRSITADELDPAARRARSMDSFIPTSKINLTASCSNLSWNLIKPAILRTIDD
jgi:hypothetical protein